MHKFTVGDLVKINSGYIDSDPPNMGIVVGVRYSASMILEVVWYRVAVWGSEFEFMEEELTLASGHNRPKETKD
jgi:hypothetical protein